MEWVIVSIDLMNFFDNVNIELANIFHRSIGEDEEQLFLPIFGDGDLDLESRPISNLPMKKIL